VAVHPPSILYYISFCVNKQDTPPACRVQFPLPILIFCIFYIIITAFSEIASKKGQKYMPYPAFDRSFQMYYNEGKKDMKGQTYL